MGYYRPWYRPYYWEKPREAEARVTPEAPKTKKVTYKRKYNKTHYKNVTLKAETYRLLKEACREKPFMDCVHEIAMYYVNNMGVKIEAKPIEVTKTEAEVRVTPEVTPTKAEAEVKPEAEAPKVTPRPILPRARAEDKIEKLIKEIRELREKLERSKLEKLKKMAEAKPG